MTDDDLLTRIRDLADGLTKPHVNREPYDVWTGSRHRKIRHHITIQHGLLRQLYAAVIPTWATTDDPGAGVPASRPPLQVEALSRHDQITAAAQGWCSTAGVQPRATTESTIRALVGRADNLDHTQQKALHADLSRWTSWCRVYLGLERIHTARGARCPLAECQKLGTLRINLTTSYGLCVECGATWNRDNIGVLANHIKTSRGAAA